MNDRKLVILGMASMFLMAACGQSEPVAPTDTGAESSAAPEAAVADLATTLASDLRSEEDRARDAGRKPAKAISFIGIQPGMDVIDLLAATGWYSEVLSIAVGSEGSVTAQNPPFMLAFRNGTLGDVLQERIDDHGLTNVTRLDSTWDELGTSGAQYDAAWSALNIHDVHYLESAASVFASAVFTVLKPGGVLAIIEHAGNPDGDNASLHRIERGLAVEILTAAGFVLEDESDLLANPDDDRTQGVFSEGIRGNTDRFVLRFRKPAS
jgi:predicted methyltransferase